MLPPAAAVAAAPAPELKCEKQFRFKIQLQPSPSRRAIPGEKLVAARAAVATRAAPPATTLKFTEIDDWNQMISLFSDCCALCIPPLQLFLHGATTGYLSVLLQSCLSGSYVSSSESSSCSNDGQNPYIHRA